MIGASVALLAAGAWFFVQTGDYNILVLTVLTVAVLLTLVVALGRRR